MASGGTLSRQIHLEEISAATNAATLAQARELLLEYGRFVIAQPGAGRFCFGSLETEAARLPASYTDQGGGSLIAFADREPAGFVAWRAVPATVAPDAWELKRLWVRPAARGLGLGKTLTLAALDRARLHGPRLSALSRARLSTLPRLQRQPSRRPCIPGPQTIERGCPTTNQATGYRLQAASPKS